MRKLLRTMDMVMVLRVYTNVKLVLPVFLSSVPFSHSVVSDSLRPHELQHARPNLAAITLYPWDFFFFFFFVANFIYFLFFLFLNNVHRLLNSD